MNIYVSNIAFKATDNELRELFEQHGEVTSAKIILDKMTQRSRGFGFIEMPDTAAAQKAIAELNNFNFLGKDLSVNEARPKTDSTGGGGYGNRSGGSSFKKRW